MQHLSLLDGLLLQSVPPGATNSYFLTLFALDPTRFSATTAQFAEALRKEGVNAKANLVTGGKPVYLYDLFQERLAFPGSHYPFASLDTGSDRCYPKGLCPVAEGAFERWIVLELLENYTSQNVDEMAHAIGKVAHHFRLRASAPTGSEARGSARN